MDGMQPWLLDDSSGVCVSITSGAARRGDEARRRIWVVPPRRDLYRVTKSTTALPLRVCVFAILKKMATPKSGQNAIFETDRTGQKHERI